MTGCIAVLTTRAEASERKDILSGIGKAAFSQGLSVAVFSNIYNHWINDSLLNFENVIYSLFDPKLFDGVIIDAEAFPNIEGMKITDGAVEKIRAAKIPCVAVDGKIEGLMSLSSDDSDDLELIAEHLICGHGYKRIDVLTSDSGGSISERRLEGIMRAFSRHGITPAESRIIHSGNFWDDSGEALGKRYACGELSLPEAVICLNDYMAFGLCKALTDAGIKVPDDVAVTGYDTNEDRVLHYPYLTSMRRDRHSLGIKAVEMITGKRCPIPKKVNEIVYGMSCPCGLRDDQIRSDVSKTYATWDRTVIGPYLQFSGSLTACRTLSEYTSVLSEYFYILRPSEKLFLCIDSEWNSPKFSGEEFMRIDIDGGGFTAPETVSGGKLVENILAGGSPAMYYFSPLYYQMRLFGYTVLKISSPESYDFSFLDWSKTAGNTLEFLRMKNDIDYLTQCRKVSELYDSLTGFYNLGEFRSITGVMEPSELEECEIFAVRLGIPEGTGFSLGENFKSEVISAVASALKSTVKNHEVLCRAKDTLFLILVKNPDEYFYDRIKAMVCCAVCSSGSAELISVKFESCRADGMESLLKADQSGQAPSDGPYYRTMLQIRSRIYSSPKRAPSKESEAKALCLSPGYFAAVYRNTFGVSYQSDCINAKITLAKYLLCTTVMSVFAVANTCGYNDEKYFARQFRQLTGCSPVQYRNAAYRT